MHKTKIITYIAVLTFLLIAPTAVSKTIYVDTDSTGANDGSSWADAYQYLQDAMADANSSEKPVEIRVAQGVYKPDRGGGNVPGDREATFQLINGVTLKGGYAGFGEPDPDARDTELYKTILNGDLSDNDTPINDIAPMELYKDPSRADNSLRVITTERSDPNTLLDGLVVTTATEAGLHISNFANVTVSNCVFVNNAASGIVCHASEPNIVDCTFENNIGSRRGGGIDISGNPQIIRCTFKNNWAENGGGLYSRNGRLRLEECTFVHNIASGLWYADVGLGGGVCVNRYQEGSKIENCIFTDNIASTGGGAHFGHTGMAPSSRQDDTILLTGCVFVRNQALRGGAISQSLSKLNAQYCMFHANSAVFDRGGAISTSFSFTNISNSIFSGNSASDRGACVYIRGGRGLGNRAVWMLFEFELALKNCTFIGNFSPTGRTMACNSDENTKDLDSTTITNCILDNSGNEIHNPDGSTIAIAYTNLCGGVNAVQDPHNAMVWSDGNIDIDPLFANPGYWASADDLNQITEPNDPNAVWVEGDYHLKSQAGRWDPNSESWVIDEVTSPCIDAGDPNSPIGLEPFPNGGRINMGAYGGTAEASKSYSEEP